MNKIKKDYLTSIKKDWSKANTSFPDFLSIITSETKLTNELFIVNFSNDIQKQIKSFPHFPLGRKKWKQQTLSLIDSVIYHEPILNIHNYMNRELLKSLQDELSEFLILVRNFSPELDFEGIGQAIRNYIVYAMFKQLNNKNTPLNKACFGYSMLYPFTDNFIDSSHYSANEKLEYNQMIRDKIKGRVVKPLFIHHKKTCQLLQEIENLYNRNCHSDIYTLLLMMLEAQEESLRQQNKKYNLSSEERLNISLYKGGISVLIDYYFVNSSMTDEDLYFYLSFGFFLQLSDDLQDISEDLAKGGQTLFTVDTYRKSQEKLVNKMLHFINSIMNTYKSSNEEFKVLLLNNCYQLIFMSVIESSAYFSEEYLYHLEQYLPVTLSFWKNARQHRMEKKDIKTQLKYMQILDAMLV